jgi:hypothetical protein
MKIVTIDQVMAWGPCKPYTRERVTELFNGGDMLTAWDISVLDIPIEDRIWALLHSEFFTDSDLRLIACAFAERILPIYERKYPGDYRPRETIRVARLFAMDYVTISELRDARHVASYTSSGASWTCAWDDAVSSAWATSWASARHDAWEEARSEEYQAQLKIIKRYLEGNDAKSNY